MNKKIILILFSFLFFNAACGYPIHLIENQPSRVGSKALIQVEVAAILTGNTKIEEKDLPTVSPLPSPEPTAIPVPTVTLVPNLDRFFQDGALIFPQSKNQINILLLGSDKRPISGYRTDVMILLNLNPDTGKASIVSFPRDLYLLLPDYGYERINTVLFQELSSSVVTNLDLNAIIKHLLMANDITQLENMSQYVFGLGVVSIWLPPSNLPAFTKSGCISNHINRGVI